MKYPQTPGYKAKDTETSAQAATAVKVDADNLRDLCEAALKIKDRTADEVADAVGRGILSVRPRISELKKLGRVTASKSRRSNSSGHTAVVWSYVHPTNIHVQQDML